MTNGERLIHRNIITKGAIGGQIFDGEMPIIEGELAMLP